VFGAVEINSSFYRRHKRDTWQRWADSVPDTFRFAVKIPKTISHELRLVGAEEALAVFIDDIAPLAPKLGPLLLQLPPTLDFQPDGVERFLGQLRGLYSGALVIEPRHLSWASAAASTMLAKFAVSRVAADPSAPELYDAAMSEDLLYLRLHGTPRIYYSAYEPQDLDRFASLLTRKSSTVPWCIFDNTASGAALLNALDLAARLEARGPDDR